MPDIHIRNVASDLLRDLNVAAAKESKTQRAYLIQAITEALNGLGEAEGVISPPKVIDVRRSVRERPRLDEGRFVGDAEARRSHDRAQPDARAMERSLSPNPSEQAKKWVGHKHAPSCDCGRCQ